MMSSEVNEVSKNFCSVSLYLYGNSISLDDVSGLLGLTPMRSRNRGDVRITSSGSEVVQQIGFWEYRVRVNADQVSSSIVEIFSQIACAKVVGEAGIEKAELDIFSPLDAEGGDGGFSVELPANLLSKLSVLGFDVIVTSR